MKRKIKDICIIIIVMAISIVIFVYRDRIVDVGQWGYLGVFALCLLSNLTILLPAPSLMVVVSCSRILNPLLVSVVGAAGTTIGELSGYLIGNSARNLSDRVQKVIQAISRHIKKPELLVFIFALLPLPIFDLAGMFAGGKRMPIIRFFLSCYLGKLLKMLFYATVVAMYIDRLIK